MCTESAVLHINAASDLKDTSIKLPLGMVLVYCLFSLLVHWLGFHSPQPFSLQLQFSECVTSHCAQLSCVWWKQSDWQSLFKTEYAFLPPGMTHAKRRTFPLIDDIYLYRSSPILLLWKHALGFYEPAMMTRGSTRGRMPQKELNVNSQVEFLVICCSPSNFPLKA